MTPAPVTTAAPWWVAPAVIAALVALAGVVASLLVNGRRSRVDRQRQRFSDAFGDVAAYREFPYVVRRRRHDEPEAERARISSELAAVQQRLNHHRATLPVESRRVGAAYAELVDATRRVAGAEIHKAWDLVPITDDAHVHVTIDLSGIDAPQSRYLLEVRDHLALTPAVLRRLVRWCVTAPGARWRRFTDAAPASTTAASPP
jgi:hypothetical protein